MDEMTATVPPDTTTGTGIGIAIVIVTETGTLGGTATTAATIVEEETTGAEGGVTTTDHRGGTIEPLEMKVLTVGRLVLTATNSMRLLLENVVPGALKKVLKRDVHLRLKD
jgi:hypothetical protein